MQTTRSRAKRIWSSRSLVAISGALGVTLASAFAFRPASGSEVRDPWGPGELIAPRQLAAALKGRQKPLIVCVGFEILYHGAHVPGAVFKGPAAEAQGVERLKAWAKGLGRKREVVIYCGCCPWKDCPNVRPAYSALKSMGFTRLRVMEIEKDFPTDWVNKGYPTQRGQ